MARVLITGGHGFIGRNLARYLSQSGHHVGGIGHGAWPPSEAIKWGIQAWINADVTFANLSVLEHDFGTPDLVFHLAGGSSVGLAIQNPLEDFSRTVASTAELLDWVRRRAPKAALVAISSAAVYGATHAGRIVETAKLTPYSSYGYHKLMMENLCRSYAIGYGIQIAVARLFSVYGPGLEKQLLWDLCSQLSANPHEILLGGTGGELRDWTHVADIVRALVDIGRIASAEMPILNVGTGIGTPVGAIARRLIGCWQPDAEAAPALRFSGRSRPGDPFSLVAGGDALDRLGFSWQHRIEQGLAEYVRWYRARDGAGA